MLTAKATDNVGGSVTSTGVSINVVTPGAIILLQEALSIARQLGERPRERDALLNLGLAVKAAGQLGRALETLTLALTSARAAVRNGDLPYFGL